MKYKSLFLVHKDTRKDYVESIEEYKQYILTHTPYDEVEFVVKVIDFPITYTYIRNMETEKGPQAAFAVATGRREAEKYINMKEDVNNVVMICPKQAPLYVANWTFINNSLYSKTYYTECVSDTMWPHEDLLRILSHEFYHVEHARANQEGFETIDSMDSYDYEYETFSKLGNRARNNAALQPYWQQKKEKEAKPDVSLLKQLADALLALIPLLQKQVARKKLEKAIIQVESRGNDKAIGDKNLKDKAYGPMQIRQPAVTDVNKRYGTTYKAEDMLGNRPLSIDTFWKYMEIYATEKNLGHKPTNEDYSRIWNGGMGGVLHPERTDHYWKQVKNYL